MLLKKAILIIGAVFWIVPTTVPADQFIYFDGKVVEGDARDEDDEYFTVRTAQNQDKIVFKSDLKKVIKGHSKAKLSAKKPSASQSSAPRDKDKPQHSSRLKSSILGKAFELALVTSLPP